MVRKAKCASPAVILRVPGRWRSWQELTKRLPDGFAIEGQHLRMPDGHCMYFECRPADAAFPEVFRMVCTRPPLHEVDWREIQNYQMNAVVVGHGGSRPAAQRMLEAGAALVMAGGAGVFIDNSAIAHGANDWLEITRCKEDPQALFYAFVGLANVAGDIVSHGMHVFGRPDGALQHHGNLEQTADALRALLKDVYEDRQTLRSGLVVHDHRRTAYRVRSQRGGPHVARIRADHPMQNPFGCFRFERQ